MISLPKIFKKKQKESEFLVLEIGLERINCAIFRDEGSQIKLVGVGRKKFSSNDEIFNSCIEALDSLAAIVSDFPREGVLGISGGSLETITTIARFDREKPKREIDVDETQAVLKQVVESIEKVDKKIFFTSIANAKIDGVRVTNPIGLKGKKVELSCFVALKSTKEIELLNKIADEIDLKLEKVVPTAFSVAKVLEHKNLKDVLLLRAAVEKSELTILEDGQVSEVLPVNLGLAEEKLLPLVWESALKEAKKETLPDLIWIFGDSDNVNLEKLKELLSSYDWSAGLKFPVNPKIEIAEAVHNFSPSDIGLYALGQEGVDI